MAEDVLERVRRLVSEGARLLAARRPGEALPLLAEAWDLDPHNAVTAINLGGAYILQGKFRRAIPILEEAARLEPDNPMVWTNLAAAYLGRLSLATLEQQDRAIAAYERVLALDPRTPHVHYNLGLIYLERRDLVRAAAYFHEALLTDPADRDAQFWLDKIARGDLDARENTG
ncbi:MAG: tetratricopeptide repeat protein [Anaerolineae bacterium]